MGKPTRRLSPGRHRVTAALRGASARFRALDRRDRLRLTAFLAVVGVLGLIGIGAGDHLHPTDSRIPGSESAKEAALSKRAFGREHTLLILLKGPPAVLDRQGPAIAERFARVPDLRVLDPWRAGGPALRPKPTEAELFVGVDKSFDDSVKAAPGLRKLLRRTVKPPLEAHMTGFSDVNQAILQRGRDTATQNERVAAPILVLILVLILGSPIAAGMPLFLGGCVAAAAAGAVELVNAHVAPLEVTSIVLATATALALGVDYSLLLVARFRRELAAGASVREASDIAAAQAGRTVKFAAGVLGLALIAAMLTSPAGVLKSAMAGALSAVVLSLFGAIVALPPLLRWAGHDINRFMLFSPAAESGRWGRLALTALRRPALAALLVLGLMLALASPVLGFETGPPDPRMLPRDDPARVDFDAIEHDLGATRAMPFVVTVVANRGTLADKRLNELARFERELRGDRQTAQVLGPTTIAARTAELAAVPGRLRQASKTIKDGQDGANRLEHGLALAAGGANELVGGLTTAAAGSAQLHAGGQRAEQGVEQLDVGAARAHRGAFALRDGLASAVPGAKALASGSAEARRGAETLASKLELVERKTREAVPQAGLLADGLVEGARRLRKLKEPADIATENASEALQALDAMLPTSKADPQYERAYRATATALGALTGRDPTTGEQVREGYDGMSAALEQGASQAELGGAAAGRLRDGLAKLSDGLGKLAAGGTKLAGGLGKLESGNAQLATGATQLLAGTEKLAGGLGQLSGGTGQLLNGMRQLDAGSGQLAGALSSGASRAAPLVGGLGRLHRGARTFGKRTAKLSEGLGDIDRLTRVFGSGYATIAAIDSAPASQRAAAGWAINYDRGGTAVHYLVAQRVSFAPGASPHDLPTRAGDPYRERLERRVHGLADRLGATAAVGGPLATLADFNQSARSTLPPLILVVLLVIYLALVPLMRSLFLPIIAVALNVLTVLATFGVMELAFGPQRLLGGVGYVDDMMVMLVFTVTFALSIDYSIFILDRMREGYDRTRSGEGAIAYGIEGTAGVLAGAAAIMACVFLTFLLSPLVSLRQAGLGLSTAVILDATLIRLVFLPAAVRLAGERIWRTPRLFGWTSRRPRPGMAGPIHAPADGQPGGPADGGPGAPPDAAMSVSAETIERGARGTRARRLALAARRDAPLLAVLAVFVAEPSTRDFALANLAVQALLFSVGACVPAYRTGLMLFVDGVWPCGLIAIGAQALLFGDVGSPALLVVAGIYVAIGARAAIWGLVIALTGFPTEDLPRFHYRRLVWRREGYRSETAPMLHEILEQGLSNVSFLATPAMLAVADRDGPIGPVVVAGAALWAVGYALESLADLQKARFVGRAGAAGSTRTCDTGLWRYSRHPNYFFQWVQWHGLVLVALPSLIRVADEITPFLWIGFAAALVSIPAGMYYVLVHFTGAVPAEHFSVEHRPDYRRYQRRVNRFFPGPSR